MCGITGWVSYGSDITQCRDVINRMTETMACRGPDAAGVWLAREVGLGHRRLAVIDLPGGVQPMTVNQSGVTIALVYSGEVYNYLELRDELTKSGHFFRTNSDTEVILRGYLEWGDQVVERLNGMFAFAIWDDREARLVMARDRLGIKPFYYYPISDGVVFGSEPKALFENPHVDQAVDSAGLMHLIAGIPAVQGRSIWKNCYEIEPGSIVIVDKSGIRTRCYWRLQTRVHTEDLESTVAAVRELLTDIVQRQMIADVPQSVLLSGGLDSSSITALAAANLADRNEQVQTYSIDYVEQDDSFFPHGIQLTRDLPYAHEVAAKVNSSHRDVVLSVEDLADPRVLQAATRARDTPCLGQMDTSLYLLFKAIRSNSTVALSGESADEIFGGYPFIYNREMQENVIDSVKFARRALSGSDWLDKDISNHVETSYISNAHTEWLSEVEYLDNETAEERNVRVANYLAIRRGLPMLLERKDRMSMAVGLEVRVPYCDHRLVEYMYNVPFNFKYANGVEKDLLRKAVVDLLPISVLQRKKSGYPSSHSPAYTEVLRRQANDALTNSKHLAFEIMSHKWLNQVVKKESDSAESNLSLQGQLGRALSIFTWFDMYNPRIELS